MLEISNIKVYDLKESVIACRNAMRLDMPSYSIEEFNKGLERAKKLCKSGSGHANFRKGIRVSFDMKYTQYITKQFQRYHFFDYVSSSSLMHRITQMDFTKCCNKYVDNRVIAIMQELISDYNIGRKKLDLLIKQHEDVDKNTEELIKDFKNHLYISWMKIISNCPMGCELFTRVSTNYEQLATIYKQRKNHKLKEDWGEFIDFINSLPYSDELIKCTN
mgnify:CR=1 FL=1